LPEPVENLLYIVKIKVLAMRAKVSSISTQGRQIVIKPLSADSPLKIRGERGVMSKYLDSAIKVGVTQIRLDTRLLGDRWKAVLEEILSSGCG
jgi:transcription-repair coupling factor (superfamily II helicase)